MAYTVAAAQAPMTTQPGFPGGGAGSIRVQVLDSNHSFLPVQALVRLQNVEAGRETWDKTHERSETIFYHLSPGTWQVQVSAPGYITAVRNVEVLNLPDQTTIQVVLRPDPGTELYKAPDDKSVPPKAREESQHGVDDLQSGNVKGAEKHFHQALIEAPQNAQINYLLGVALLRQKHVPEAEKSFMQAISLDPHHALALTTMGGLRMEEKDLPAATKLLAQAISADPNQWRAHWLMANTRLLQDQNEEARSQAELAIKLSNDSAPAARLILGEALGNLGQYKEAISSLQRFLQQAPTSRDVPAVRKMISEMQDALKTSSNAAPR
jgi:Flp pilus assembly protein TadD